MVEVAEQPFLGAQAKGHLLCHECCCQRFLDLQLDAYSEIEHVKLHEAWQDDEIEKLKRHFSAEFTKLSQRLATLESSQSQWDELRARFVEDEQAIAQNLQSIDDLSLRVEALEKGSPENDLERAVREINSRGNVRFDIMSGHMQVLKEIVFVPVKAAEKPVATLRDPHAAAVVLDDIAAVGALFANNVLTVEGHTGGGNNEFWQQLADDRARLVGNELISRGHRAEILKTKGLPGKNGINKSEVKVVLSMTREELAAMRSHVVNKN